MQQLHLHEDVEQEMCIEIQLQDAHLRDHGPVRDETGRFEEAAAHHAPKQTTHDTTSTQILQHPRKRHNRPITGGPRWNRDDRPNRVANNGHRRFYHTQRRSHHRREPIKRRASESGAWQAHDRIRGNTRRHPVYDERSKGIRTHVKQCRRESTQLKTARAHHLQEAAKGMSRMQSVP